MNLSTIVAGAMHMARWNMTATERLTWIKDALALGITSFDHADIYGDYQVQQLFGQPLQSFQLGAGHIGRFVLFKPEHKKPTTGPARSNQSAGATTLTPTRQSNALFEHITSQISIHQPTDHLAHSKTQSVIRQIRFTHPSGELAGFEDAAHR